MSHTADDQAVPAESSRLNLRRMHHAAYVVKDQEATRHFYEDVVGLPLVATWAEVGEFSGFPGRQVEFCHTFFGLADGGALAFFAFADDDVYEAVKRQPCNGFTHAAIAVSPETQRQMKTRLESAGYSTRFIDHGFCQSLYVDDPDQMVLELTSDPENVAEINAWQADTARETLGRWVAGDRTPNNDLRHP
jgi:catechol 2,3-dioxygenase-like lactoylglutathione lyase family enzyme